MEQCPRCKLKYSKYPLYEIDENGNKKFIIKNFFKMDISTILFLISVVILIFGTQSIIADCNDAIYDPCTFCKQSGCCVMGIVGESNSTIQDLNMTIKPFISTKND